MINKILIILTRNIPGRTGFYIREFLYSRILRSCGKNLKIDIGVVIENPHLVTCGDNVYIDKYTLFLTGDKIVSSNIKLKSIGKKHLINYRVKEGEILIGSNIHICQFCILVGYGGLVIDDETVISANTKIYSMTNSAYDRNNRKIISKLMPYEKSQFVLGNVIIAKNTFIGLNNIIFPGCYIGKNSFIANNSSTINSFCENSYISGCPSKKIKKRFLI